MLLSSVQFRGSTLDKGRDFVYIHRDRTGSGVRPAACRKQDGASVDMCVCVCVCVCVRACVCVWRHAVAQLFEALLYKPEGRGFDSQWCHWNFSLT